VASVLLREAFAFKDVAQMAATMTADYLNATPVRIPMALHGAREFVVKAGPTATRLELGLGRIERVVAAPANKSAGRIQRFVLAAERHFRSFIDNYSLFVGR
jgi:hypothetical protein